MPSKSTAVATKEAATDVAPLPERSPSLLVRVSARFGVEPDKMLEALKTTAFRQRPATANKPAVVVTNEQMMMLLIVAEQYHLNPFTKEIYAFPQDGGIVPIIGFDGWMRLINEHPMLDSIEIVLPPDGTEQDDWYTEVIITRKDRSKPIVIREYLKENYRNTDPWNEMPRRMIRHRAIIQCGRVAFGFAGVFDPDEGERVFAAARDITPRNMKPATSEPQRKAVLPPADIEPTGNYLSQTQLAELHAKLDVERFDQKELAEAFSVDDVSLIPAEAFEAALKFIDDHSEA